MKLLFWIVGLPLLLLAAFFAIANRELVTVSLWPFADPIEIPLFAAIVAPLYFGVLIGAVAGWWSGRRARARARAEARRADALERETAKLKSQMEAMDRGRTPVNNPALTDNGKLISASAPPSFMP
jgi:uncharacterized integral membrane protein